MINYLLELVKSFRNADRIGDAEDNPEGSRFVQMSDTLVDNICEGIEDIGWDINKIIDWYEQYIQVKDDSPYNRCRCPICNSYWIGGFPELHKTDCWIPNLKRTAFMAKRESEQS